MTDGLIDRFKQGRSLYTTEIRYMLRNSTGCANFTHYHPNFPFDSSQPKRISFGAVRLLVFYFSSCRYHGVTSSTQCLQ